MSGPVSILSTGLVSSVGLSAPASCAAIRAGATNPTETRFIDSAGEWIMAHQVPLEEDWRGRVRLVKLAAMSIRECLAHVPQSDWPRIPLLLCVAERDRPGRTDGLDDELFPEIQVELATEFAATSLVIPQGRVSCNLALKHARELVSTGSAPFVLIAATDSLLSWPTLSVYEQAGRLLTPENSNGFMPGEASGAALIGAGESTAGLSCLGLGFASEPAHVNSDEPLRGEGLTRAIRIALAEAGCAIHDLDFRITDVSGEQYFFKEAALALGRLLRVHKEALKIWHAAQCVGEIGAAAGLAAIAVADAACRKNYAPGPGILYHAANDGGQRAAAVFNFRTRQ
jgi:3-oxoacyl-[acyl-carrier-protein] synthase-1